MISSRSAPHYVRAAREEALLACDLYNQRRRERDLEAFITHMLGAWLNLFYAICVRDGIDFYYRIGRRIQRLDGEAQKWDLNTCVRHFIPNRMDPLRANLEFFLKLRNRIEHRYAENQMRSLEAIVAGKVQALLINFERATVKEFGKKRSLGEALRFPVFVGSLTEDPIEIAQRVYARLPQALLRFIESYDAALDPAARLSEAYEFRIYLMSKQTAGTTADLAVEFIDVSKLSPQEAAAIENARVIIRDRHIEAANLNRLKAGEVVGRVQIVYPAFSLYLHSLAWAYHKIRPRGNAEDPTRTDARYAVYDRAHKDYLYTESWVERLKTELAENAEAALTTWKTAKR